MNYFVFITLCVWNIYVAVPLGIWLPTSYNGIHDSKGLTKYYNYTHHASYNLWHTFCMNEWCMMHDASQYCNVTWHHTPHHTISQNITRRTSHTLHHSHHISTHQIKLHCITRFNNAKLRSYITWSRHATPHHHMASHHSHDLMPNIIPSQHCTWHRIAS